MNQKQAKRNRRMIRKACNRMYDRVFEDFMKDYIELTFWEKIKLAFKTEKLKRGRR
ncbi:MAG: hypothetical protein MJ176_03010 [Treponema sp.]|nr:hypothetical protein [Treponema sp.]